MNEDSTKQISRLGSPLRLFNTLMLAIFSIEFIVMFILPKLFPDSGGIIENLMDALLLTLLSAPIMWYLIVQPLRNVAMQEIAYTKFVLEHVVDAVAILRKEGIVESFNLSAERLFGFASVEVTGMEIKSLLPEMESEAEIKGAGGGNRELMGRQRDGRLFPLELSVSNVSLNGQWKQICIMRDITPRKQAEAEIRQLNKELKQKVADRTRQLIAAQEKLLQEEKLTMLGRIAGNMGNELRNPLGVMSNAVFFLQTVMPDADDTVREYLEIIGEEIDNSQRIISELLNYCSGSSPRTEPFTVQDLIRHSRELCTIPDNISFFADLPATLPKVLADPLQIGQVFRNLITNAVQAMPAGGTLRVAARQILNSELGILNSDSKSKIQNPKFEEDFVEISVIDSGKGIAAENMEKLFQPLFTTKSRGIGLGLAISRKLTEMNGGRIWAESEFGKGTTFTVTLPVERGEG